MTGGFGIQPKMRPKCSQTLIKKKTKKHLNSPKKKKKKLGHGRVIFHFDCTVLTQLRHVQSIQAGTCAMQVKWTYIMHNSIIIINFSMINSE